MSAACTNCGFQDCWSEDRFCIKCGRRIVSARPAGEELATVTMKVADAAYVQVKLGAVYRKKGNLEAAIRAFKKALEIDPACAAAQAALDEVAAEAGLPLTGTDA